MAVLSTPLNKARADGQVRGNKIGLGAQLENWCFSGYHHRETDTHTQTGLAPPVALRCSETTQGSSPTPR
jgi:hypothetical protein